MTNIEQKALALLNEVRSSGEGAIHPTHNEYREALCRAIKQHEAFRQEVSDALWDYFRPYDSPLVFQRFIISKPKTDPLVDAMDKLEWCNTDALAKDLRDTLDALGFEIREKNDG